MELCLNKNQNEQSYRRTVAIFGIQFKRIQWNDAMWAMNNLNLSVVIFILRISSWNFTVFTNPLEEPKHICILLVMILINCLYLWWIYKGGPEYMKKRQPYNVTSLIRIYNICQVFTCAIFVIESHRIGLTFNYLLTW